MTKPMLLQQLKQSEKQLEELKVQAEVEMTFELQDKLECAALNLWSISYALEAIEHGGSEEAVCLVIPIN